MSLLVVGLLALLWASILLPGALRSRRETSPQTTVDSFARTMSMLGTRAGNASVAGRQVLVLPPPPPRPSNPRARVIHRRRQILARLAIATPTSALLALIVGGPFWLLFGAAAAASCAYVAALAYLQSRKVEARRKVRPIPVRAPVGARRRLDGLAVGEHAHGG